MQFHDRTPPIYDESEEPQMVDESPALSSFAVQDDTRSESGFSRSSWRSVVTQQSWRSAASWKNLGCMRPDIERRIRARLHPGDKSSEDHPVSQGSNSANIDASLRPDMVYVQRASCPAEALTVASGIGSQADAPIFVGSINIPEDIVEMEVEPKGVDMNQEVLPTSAQSFAIVTPPAQADPTENRQEEQRTGHVDLENGNYIQTDHADFGVPEDPVISATAEAVPAVQRSSPEPKVVTAEVDPDDELTKFLAYLQENVPWWTVDPDFEDWCDPANPEGSLAEDTQRKIELGDSFEEKFRSEYSGAKLRWAETIFARYANWWKKKG